ncbi:MAG: YbaN family protein [Spirochaetota bacterium]|nr:YbaN family protein [Spirochaetota bacterium]
MARTTGKRNVFTRWMFNIAGSICVILGILGIILPLLPTTPFLLLAAACYFRGSEKLYNKLINNRRLGPFIKNFQEKKAIPFRAKIYTLIILWSSLAISIITVNKTLVHIILPIVGIGVTALILKIRTLRSEA